MPEITMYTTSWCGYCVRAKMLLDSLGLPYEEIDLDDDPHFRQRLFDLDRRLDGPADRDRRDGRTAPSGPQGGYVELWKLEREGKLAA